FCDWYIEMSKARLSGDDRAARRAAQAVLARVLTGAMQLLHPFMPFITDEIFRHLPGAEGSVMVSAWPGGDGLPSYADDARRMEGIMEAVRAVRNLRAEMKVSPGRRARLIVRPREGWQGAMAAAESYFVRLASASAVELLPGGAPAPDKAASAVCAACELYVPLGELVDVAKELARLGKDRESVEKDVARVEGKLNNPGFLAKAPEALVAAEREKLVSQREVLRSLDSRIEELKSL
ncbi:MAG: class I tRNA ligase family protein, partial [Clostridiales bacterium]|nr:class I tRNA ligase family protein [Clostridiales bacterium]